MVSDRSSLRKSWNLPPQCLASGAAACGDPSVFSSTSNCELSTVDSLSRFALCHLLSFHTNTNCPICNFLVLITIRNARGWVGGARDGGVKVILELPPQRIEREELTSWNFLAWVLPNLQFRTYNLRTIS